MKKVKGWLVYDQAGAEYNKQYINMHMDEAKIFDIELELKFAENICIEAGGVKKTVKYDGKSEALPDFVICRTINPKLSKELEDCGIKVFNNSKVSEIANDKEKAYTYLEQFKIPMLSHIPYCNEAFKEHYHSIPDGWVIKAVAGHGGSQVFLKGTDKEDDIRLGIGECDVVTQPLFDESMQDVRVYVIGNEIICAIRRTAVGGFKSNFSLGGSVDVYELSEEQKSVVNMVIKQFDFGLVGIDFLIGKDGRFIFNEIEDVVGARMLYKLTDINLVRLYLQFIISKCVHRGL